MSRITPRKGNSSRSHGKTGTQRFACLDGEGVKGYDSPDSVSETHCIDCTNDITHCNRYWISETGPYCHDCYFRHKNTSIGSMMKMVKTDES